MTYEEVKNGYREYAKELRLLGQDILADLYEAVADIPDDKVYKYKEGRPNWLTKDK